MCGRFELNTSKEKLSEKFSLDSFQLDTLQPRFNIPPTSQSYRT